MKKTTVVFDLDGTFRYVTGSRKCSQLCTGTSGNAKAYIRGSASICRKWRASADDPGSAGWGEQSII